MENETCYKAVLARDKRFDGRFFTAVLTTGIFCRPICPARPPKRENCRFMPTAAAAQAAGFRPCLRCRPELSPDLPGWNGTSTTIKKALKYISEGFLNDHTVSQLADKLGMGERHFRRLFQHHMGTNPQTVTLNRRLLMAKQLLTDSDLSITEVAHASGFQSLRRFNGAMKKNFCLKPTDIRKNFKSKFTPSGGGLNLKLPVTAPYNWEKIITYLKPRAIPGVEFVSDRLYARTFHLKGKAGRFTVSPDPKSENLLVALHFPDLSPLPVILSRIKNIFDLEANMAVINDHLSQDPDLKWRIDKCPGIRVIGAWDPFELTVRAILGQQVSVAAATTLIGRIVSKYGIKKESEAASLSYLFPPAEILAKSDLSGMGITGNRIKAIVHLAQTVTDDPDFFDRPKTFEDFRKQLCSLPGIGEWTASYIAMRAMRDADAFPASDLVLLKRMEKNGKRPTARQLELLSEKWRPWRAYAAMYLWNVENDETTDL